MPIKLLPKSEIAKAKVKDRQLEIQEGAKLASRVDNLRETVATEEKALSDFRREALSSIQKDIEELTAHKNALGQEVVFLEERKQAALAPFTVRKAQIRHEEKLIADEKADLSHNREVLRKERNLLDAQFKEVAKIRKDTLTQLTESRRVLNDADSIKTETERKNRLTEHTLQEAVKEATRIIHDAQAQKKDAERREIAVKEAEEDIGDREALLKTGWILLKDREATYARNIKRNK